MKLTTSMIAGLLLFALISGAEADDKKKTQAIQLFNGKSLDGWKIKGNNTARSKWAVGAAAMAEDNNRNLIISEPVKGTGELINAQGRGVDIFSETEFGDCHLSIEVMVPKGSNSGIYFHGNYEIQILDSFGKKKIGPGDIGAIYGAAVARVNAARAPGKWQQFEVDFQAPKFKDGKKVANARFPRVVLNGKVIHEDVEVTKVTGGNLGRGEGATGPLMFQGDHGPVAYRNIRVTPK